MIPIAAIVALFFLQCQADVPPVMKDLDENKILGTWYGIAVASNCKKFMEMKSDKMPAPVIVYSMNNGKMISSSAFQGHKGCQEMDFEMTIVEKGHYTCKNEHGENEIVILGTDYDTGLVEFTKSKMHGKDCIVLKFFGRKDSAPEDKIQQFKEHVKAMGLSEENYIRFHEKATCVPKGV